jgi:hypothetical protein
MPHYEKTFFFFALSVCEHDALVAMAVDVTLWYWYGFTTIIMCL